MNSNQKIAVIGSGLIGRSWAMLFASAGYSVCIYDVDRLVTEKALQEIQQRLLELEGRGLLRGKLSAAKQFKLIQKTDTLEECVKGAVYVQESILENAHLKIDVFRQLDGLVDDSVTLCSSTSCILPSTISDGLVHKSQMLVAHPANPPYYVPIVEVVPAPWTDEKHISKTISLMQEIGQKPVLCKKEIFGFVINRMQYSIINECWRLVDDDVISVEDIDTVMSEGLGMRYAFLGVLETCHLNANGMLDYCSRYAKGIYNVSETFGPVPQMTGKTAVLVNDQLCQKVPLDKLAERRRWRDERLAQLASLKKSLDN